MSLETHLSWREPYASVSLNRKHSGIIPPGVYRGFVVSAGGGMVLNIAPNTGDYPRSVAVVDRDGFNFTVSSDDTETFTVPDGTSGTLYLCLQSQYIEGGGGTSTFVLISSGSIQAYHIILAQLVIPGGTTEITSGMINYTDRDSNRLVDINDFLLSSSQNGYQKLPSGIIIQWGRASTVANGTTITFPIAFPNACLHIIPGYASSLTAGTADAEYASVSAGQQTTTNFVGRYWKQGVASATSYYDWIAIGY